MLGVWSGMIVRRIPYLRTPPERATSHDAALSPYASSRIFMRITEM
jgi:hypothetical protein